MKLRAHLYLAAAIVWALVPIIAEAAIVPCGGSSTVGTAAGQSLSCDLCSFGELIQNLINFLLGISVPLSAGLFAWAGILYFSSRGVPAQIERAHKIFKSVVIGFVLAVAAWTIVQVAVTTLFNKSIFLGGSWSRLDCAEQRIERAKQINKNLNQVLSGSLSPVGAGINGGLGAGTASGGLTNGGTGDLSGTTGGGATGMNGGTDNTTNTAANGSLTDDQKDALLDKCILNDDIPSCNAYDKSLGMTQPSTTPTSLTDDQKDELLDKCILNNDQTSCNAYDKALGITAVGSNQTMTVTLQDGSQLTTTCSNCAIIPSDIPGYNRSLTCSQQVGGACQMDAGLLNNVESLKSNLADAGISTKQWQVTEAWPPTVYHASEDQNLGSSIDISACNSNMGYSDPTAIGNCVLKFANSAEQSNLKAQYEVTTQAQKDQVCAAVPASCGYILPVSYITGSHFSIYRGKQ
ncbi:MAG TPA: pilin [Candidatus Paceibacterota bacterium]|jgi:hypothetical protein|nr:pilin [Candidatus Paceibacterota bacterium]